MTEQFWHSKIVPEDVAIGEEAFQHATKYPHLSSAIFNDISKCIESTWTYTDTSDLSSTKKYVCVSTIQEPYSTSRPIHVTETEMWTKNGDIEVRLVKKTNSTNAEFWIANKLEKSFNLNDFRVHGQVYFDKYFGCLAIDPSGDKIAYIAELKRPKTSSFFKPHDVTEVPGQEYNYIEDWGEQMTGKSTSVVVILNWRTSTAKVLNLPLDFCYGNILWLSSNEIIGTMTQIEAYRLGIVYTTSKPTNIFKVDIQIPDSLTMLNDDIEGLCCRSPRLSPDKNTLIWLERDLHNRSHACILRLMGLDLQQGNQKPRTIVETKQLFKPDTDDFAGMNQRTYDLPKRCFINNDEIIFSDVVIDVMVPFKCNIKKLNDVQKLLEPAKSFQCNIKKLNDIQRLFSTSESFTILDVSSESEKIIASSSSPILTHSLWIGTKQSETDSYTFECILQPSNINDGLSLGDEIICQTLIHTPSIFEEDPEFQEVKFSSYFVGPRSKPCPLILWPHGGPHAVSLKEFKDELLFWCKLGFSVLLPNYRGSLGNGQKGVFALKKHMGDYELRDSYQALQECLERFPNIEKDKLFLYGGSHGGFTVTHMAGKYPDTFRAVVARNPVVNNATKNMVCDNPDSMYALNGLDFDFKSPGPSEMETFYNISPMVNVDHVKIPIHLNLGTLDRRVPKTQGIEYYRNLKALGKQVSMNIYEDNHPLGKVSTKANILINAYLFFKSVLN